MVGSPSLSLLEAAISSAHLTVNALFHDQLSGPIAPSAPPFPCWSFASWTRVSSLPMAGGWQAYWSLTSSLQGLQDLVMDTNLWSLGVGTSGQGSFRLQEA